MVPSLPIQVLQDDRRPCWLLFCLVRFSSGTQRHMERRDTVTSNALMRVFVQTAKPVWGIRLEMAADGWNEGRRRFLDEVRRHNEPFHGYTLYKSKQRFFYALAETNQHSAWTHLVIEDLEWYRYTFKITRVEGYIWQLIELQWKVPKVGHIINVSNQKKLSSKISILETKIFQKRADHSRLTTTKPSRSNTLKSFSYCSSIRSSSSKSESSSLNKWDCIMW